MTRRDAIRVMGASAALVGLGGLSRARAQTAPPTGSGSIPQPFVLPKLPYGYASLEPHIDALTMEIHHSKHHAAYIKNANKALEGHAELAPLSAEQILSGLDSIPEPLRTTLRNNVGGHVNHTFWWEILSPAGGGEPKGDLASAIGTAFGSTEAFRKAFTEAALKRFGSGWAWLVVKGGALAITSTPNQDSPLTSGSVPIVGIDVWEHAYYLKNQNRRADYIASFWSVVDWERAGANYAAARA